MASKPQTALLGKDAGIPASPEEAILDRVPNPHPDTDYVARFTAPEFTSICPVTGQPTSASSSSTMCREPGSSNRSR